MEGVAKVDDVTILPVETEQPQQPAHRDFAMNKENVERVLLFFAISIGAYLGSYIRFGMSYYKIWHTETNYVSYLSCPV